MARDGRVDHEAADLRVLGEDALEDRLVAVGLGDRRLEIVEHHPPRHPTKEGPRVLEPIDHVAEALRPGDVHVLVAAIDERHDQRVRDALPTRLRVRHEAEAPEVDLDELPGRRVRHPHGEPPRILKAAVPHREPVQ